MNRRIWTDFGQGKRQAAPVRGTYESRSPVILITLILFVLGANGFFPNMIFARNPEGTRPEIVSFQIPISAEEGVIFSGPGEQYYETQRLVKGEVVEVYLRQEDGWCAIRPPVGSFSWVNGKYVTPDEKGDGVITGDESGREIPVRVGAPSVMKSTVIQVGLTDGRAVHLRGEMQLPGGAVWYKIAPPSGEFRWIRDTDLAGDGMVAQLPGRLTATADYLAAFSNGQEEQVPPVRLQDAARDSFTPPELTADVSATGSPVTGSSAGGYVDQEENAYGYVPTYERQLNPAANYVRSEYAGRYDSGNGTGPERGVGTNANISNGRFPNGDFHNGNIYNGAANGSMNNSMNGVGAANAGYTAGNIAGNTASGIASRQTGGWILDQNGNPVPVVASAQPVVSTVPRGESTETGRKMSFAFSSANSPFRGWGSGKNTQSSTATPSTGNEARVRSMPMIVAPKAGPTIVPPHDYQMIQPATGSGASGQPTAPSVGEKPSFMALEGEAPHLTQSEQPETASIRQVSASIPQTATQTATQTGSRKIQQPLETTDGSATWRAPGARSGSVQSEGTARSPVSPSSANSSATSSYNASSGGNTSGQATSTNRPATGAVPWSGEHEATGTPGAFDAMGVFGYFPDRPEGYPRYALLRRQGEESTILCYVEAESGENLDRFIGKTIGIRGARGWYRSATETRPVITAKTIFCLK